MPRASCSRAWLWRRGRMRSGGPRDCRPWGHGGPRPSRTWCRPRNRNARPPLPRNVWKYVELGKQRKSMINVSNIDCFVRTESVFCETSFFFSICLYWVNHHLVKIVCSHIHCPCLPGLNSRDIASLQLSFTFSTSPSVQYNTGRGRGAPGAKTFGKRWETWNTGHLDRTWNVAYFQFSVLIPVQSPPNLSSPDTEWGVWSWMHCSPCLFVCTCSVDIRHSDGDNSFIFCWGKLFSDWEHVDKSMKESLFRIIKLRRHKWQKKQRIMVSVWH